MSEFIQETVPLALRPSFFVKHRAIIAILIFLLLLPLLICGETPWSRHGMLRFSLNTLGFIFMLTGMGWRLWATLYIGGRKSVELQRSGPYSLSRHPLYFGNFAIGMGLAAYSANPCVLGVLLCYFAAQYGLTIRFEEQKLLAQFGDAFLAYQREVSQLLPRWSRFDATPPHAVHFSFLREEVGHCVVFLLLIPLMQLIQVMHQRDLLPVWHCWPG